jgi:hypothetical protein
MSFGSLRIANKQKRKTVDDGALSVKIFSPQLIIASCRRPSAIEVG